MALRMSRDAEEARDLVQEAFLRAARRPEAVPATDQGAEAWLVRVLVNLCRDRRRRLQVRGRVAALTGASEPRVEPETDRLDASAVRRALAALPARRRAVVVLHEMEERPAAEIARLLGINAVTVRWHLARARQELRRLLAVPAGAAEEPR